VFKYGIRHLIVVSNKLEEIARSEWHVSKNKCSFIPNGVDTNRFRPIPLLIKSPPETSKLIIGTIAGLRREKNLSRLIEACNIVSVTNARPIELWIVGNGEERSKLEALAKTYEDQFKTVFLGDRKDTESLLNSMNIYALSSDTEQAPISVLEAMACSLPVAAVDVGDVKSMVSDSNKKFVNGVDEKALANNMSQLIELLNQGQIIGGNNRAKVEASYSFDKSAHAWHNFLRLQRPSP
jgi:L-malate glycosyltransferase